MGIADIQRRYARVGTEPTTADHQAYHNLLEHGGFSRHVVTNEPPRGGYMVSLHKDKGGEEFVRDLSEVDPSDIAEHRQRAKAHNPNLYQGGWVHQGEAYLDRSVNVPDLDQAIEMGHKHKQLAIYDVKNDREIPIKD